MRKVAQDKAYLYVLRYYILYANTVFQWRPIGGEKQACISVGVNSPADIASGRAHIVRWTMVLRRPKRSVDLQRCAVEVCHAIA